MEAEITDKKELEKLKMREKKYLVKMVRRNVWAGGHGVGFVQDINLARRYSAYNGSFYCRRLNKALKSGNFFLQLAPEFVKKKEK